MERLIFTIMIFLLINNCSNNVQSKNEYNLLGFNVPPHYNDGPVIDTYLISKNKYSKKECISKIKNEINKYNKYYDIKVSAFDFVTIDAITKFDAHFFKICIKKEDVDSFIEEYNKNNKYIYDAFSKFYKTTLKEKYKNEIKEINEYSEKIEKEQSSPNYWVKYAKEHGLKYNEKLYNLDYVNNKPKYSKDEYCVTNDVEKFERCLKEIK